VSVPTGVRRGSRHARDDGQAPARLRTNALAIGAYVVAGVALFAVFYRLARTVTVESDQANVILMAQDMLHGNLVLHGWHASDVSFYTTELPQYALIEAVIGVREAVTHVAATMSYTLAVLLAVLLARGGVSGRRALIRTLIVAGIMLPIMSNGGTLIGTMGHLGTSVPLLVIWVLLDRGGRRWWVPPLVSVLLAWVLVADKLTLVAGVGPVAVVGVVSVLWGLGRREVRWFELSLAAAAGVAVVLAEAAEAVLRALGGYVLAPLGMHLLPLDQMGSGMAAALRQVCDLFGANFWDLHGAEYWFGLLHVVSLALLIGAVLIASLSLVMPGLGGRVTLTDQVLVVACVALVCAYGLTTASTAGPHEMAPIVPFGAALTGRVLVTRTAAREHRVPVREAALAGWVAGSLVLAGYLGGLAYAADQPVALPKFAPLASWLSAHHLSGGLGGYWVASVVTLDSGGRVPVRALQPGTLAPYWWMSKDTWYDPASSQANFLIIDTEPGFTTGWTRHEIDAAFGKPERVYHTEGTITVLVWNHNLLKDLPGSASS
jgi:hypothetical protein